MQYPAQSHVCKLWIKILFGMLCTSTAQADLAPREKEAHNPNSDLVLGLHYYSYLTAGGKPVLSEEKARSVVDDVNRLYSQCKVQFKLEAYDATDPNRNGLGYRPSKMTDLDSIRATLADHHRLVVIATGPWDNSGGLGSDGANAWTMMPGDEPEGSVLEAKVVANGHLLAHELGHYLDLDHQAGRDNLMNPVIYPDSNHLSEVQCIQARHAASSARAYALRDPEPPAVNRSIASFERQRQPK